MGANETPLRRENLLVVERKNREIGWFQNVEVKAYYLHGDHVFKEGPTFSWRDKHAIDLAKEEAHRLCAHYAISASSSLELVLICSNREEPKIWSHNLGSWQYPDRERDVPPRRLLDSFRIWSSKTGDAPDFATWPRHRLSFVKTFPIAGDRPDVEDLISRFRINIAEIEATSLWEGLALATGEIIDGVMTASTDNPEIGQGHFASLSGKVEIALDPRVSAVDDLLLALADEGIRIDVHPLGNEVYWDLQRGGDRINWSIVK